MAVVRLACGAPHEAGLSPIPQALGATEWTAIRNPPFDRIMIEPDKMGGQPCIRGLRITVKRVLDILGAYPDRTELFADYPDMEETDLQQALAFAVCL